MGYWSKRTHQQIDESVKNGDFTGGYQWWPWLLHMRKGLVFAFFVNMFLGWYGGLSAINQPENGPIWVGFALILFFGVFSPILIAFLLRRNFNDGKKGKSR